MTENELALEQLIGHLREDRHTRLGLHRITHPVGSCECSACDQLRVVTFGIEAIREMQAELAARNAHGVVVPREDWDLEDQECARRWAVDVGGVESAWILYALKDIERLKEELRIAKASLGFEECNRLRAQRGELLAQRDNALSDVERLQEERNEYAGQCTQQFRCSVLEDVCKERDEAVGKLTVMTCQRDTARRDEGRVSADLGKSHLERDDLRDRLRTADEATGKALTEAGRLRRDRNVALAEIVRFRAEIAEVLRRSRDA